MVKNILKCLLTLLAKDASSRFRKSRTSLNKMELVRKQNFWGISVFWYNLV